MHEGQAVGRAIQQCLDTGERQYVCRKEDEWYATEQPDLSARYDVELQDGELVVLDYATMTEVIP